MSLSLKEFQFLDSYCFVCVVIVFFHHFFNHFLFLSDNHEPLRNIIQCPILPSTTIKRKNDCRNRQDNVLWKDSVGLLSIFSSCFTKFKCTYFFFFTFYGLFLVCVKDLRQATVAASWHIWTIQGNTYLLALTIGNIRMFSLKYHQNAGFLKLQYTYKNHLIYFILALWISSQD